MSINFKALGGLFTFRYINDVEDLDLEDLQEIYNDLKEEQKQFNSELDKRKDQVKWGKLAEYAKHLEAEVIRLKEILISNGYTDSGVVGDSEPAKVIKELKEQLDQLKKELKEKKINATNKKIERMKSLIEEEYPLRKTKLRTFKLAIRYMQAYIEELQGLLDQNDIAYGPMNPFDKRVVDNIDNFDENAVRIMNDLENI